MGGEETENKQAEPEQTSGAAPTVVNGTDQTNPRQPQTNVPQPLSEMGSWVQKLRESLTVVTLLLFFATLGLYLSTRDLVRDAEKTAERQLRAYMLVKTDFALLLQPIGRTTDNHVIWEFAPVTENTGITPALQVEFFVYHAFRPGRDFRMKVTRAPDFRRVESPAMVDIGGHQFTKGFKFHVAGPTLNLVRDGHLRWTMFEAIVYKDIFDKRRLTQYCGIICLTPGIDYDTGATSISGQGVVSCGKYNCTDQHCDPSERLKLPKFAEPTQ